MMPAPTHQPSSSSYRAYFKTENASLLYGNITMEITRTFPTNIGIHAQDGQIPSLTEATWNQFCDEIDSVLEDLCNLRIRNARFSCFLMGLMISAFLLAPVLVRFHDVLLKSIFVLIVAVTLLLAYFLVACHLMASAKKKEEGIIQNLRLVCSEATRTIRTQRTGDGDGDGGNGADDDANHVRFFVRRRRVHSYGKRARNVLYVEVRVGSSRGSRTPDTLTIASASDMGIDSVCDSECDGDLEHGKYGGFHVSAVDIYGNASRVPEVLCDDNIILFGDGSRTRARTRTLSSVGLSDVESVSQLHIPSSTN